MRRVGSCVLSIFLLVTALIPTLTHPSPASAQTTFSPPLPMAEDPLGQQPEQQLPEISHRRGCPGWTPHRPRGGYLGTRTVTARDAFLHECPTP